MRRLMLPIAAVVLGAGWTLAAPAANAQTKAAPQNQAAPATIPDQKLDAAAAALQKVVDLQQTYKQRMATAAPKDKDRIAKEADQQLSKAVTDQGLTVDEYSSILQVAQNDPDVRQRLLQRVRPPSN
jgi:Domain of unknown function (DUF4168)